MDGYWIDVAMNARQVALPLALLAVILGAVGGALVAFGLTDKDAIQIQLGRRILVAVAVVEIAAISSLIFIPDYDYKLCVEEAGSASRFCWR